MQIKRSIVRLTAGIILRRRVENALKQAATFGADKVEGEIANSTVVQRRKPYLARTLTDLLEGDDGEEWA